jgi:hypothetical protein
VVHLLQPKPQLQTIPLFTTKEKKKRKETDEKKRMRKRIEYRISEANSPRTVPTAIWSLLSLNVLDSSLDGSSVRKKKKKEGNQLRQMNSKRFVLFLLDFSSSVVGKVLLEQQQCSNRSAAQLHIRIIDHDVI